MRIKTKIALALGGLFCAIVGVTGLSIFYLNQLSTDAENILKDNYESLEYTKQIIKACDGLSADSVAALETIDKNLALQESNITERGEKELTEQLRIAYDQVRSNGFHSHEIEELRRICIDIQELNMKSIIRKNEITSATANHASTYLIIIVSVILLIALTFIVNFPGYIANPIVSLTNSIKSIANKDYEERLRFNRKDEFGELAEAFNLMAEKLDEYDHSNLANVLFEKKRIETIINRMSDPVMGLDQNKRVVFVNDQALMLLNLDAEQTIGRYAPDIAVENDLFRNLVRSQIDEKSANSNLIKIAVNGKENYFSKESIDITIKPTGEKDSVSIGRVIILKNITPFKELDLAKTNFIATISHELKTPIASLLMGIKLLHDERVGKLNEEQLHIVGTLNDETTRLSKISGELLDLAQVETGNIKLNIQSVAAMDIIRYAMEAVKFYAERKKVKITPEVSSNLPDLRVDLDKTTWVLVNLLTNAIRFSPENGEVKLLCIRVGDTITFSVIDEGPGIEKKYVSRLFEKFFQVPGSPSGTGLGLAISKEFIEAQSGTVTVQSEPGKGSTFGFSFRI